MKHAKVPVEVSTIYAGKLRRYHGETWWQRLRDIRTIAYNIRDIALIGLGFVQSAWMLLTKRPDVVFAKGGYVCLPLGLAAALLRIPIVIHDSDTRPGLTNCVLARFAARIGTGSPLENYSYDKSKTSYVGVPISEQFRPFSDEAKQAARHNLGMIDVLAPLVVVTGGGLGARSINQAMVRSAPDLIKAGLHVYHVTGKKHFESIKSQLPDHPHYIAVPFVYRDMHAVLGAADVVVSRGSATFLQELAGLAQPTIIVPAAHLGDQVKNAAVYEAAEAAIVATDHEIADGDTLGQMIMSLINSPAQRSKLSQKLHQFARPSAARDMALIIASVVTVSGVKR